MESGWGGGSSGPFHRLIFFSLLGIAESMGQELGDGSWEVNMGEPLGR